MKGKYTPVHIYQTVTNLLLVCVVIGLMMSGIILSRDVFAALPIKGGQGFARSMHHVCAYWGFILLSLHLGLCGNRIMGMLGNSLRLKHIKMKKALPQILVGITVIYGIYGFVKHEIGLYMFNIIQFSFFDYEQPIIQFSAEYIGVMGMAAVIGYYTARWLRNLNRSEVN